MTFTIRTVQPYNNKFYMTRSVGGYSTCIQRFINGANVLPNCVGYACGRFNEIIGSMKYPSLNCNAENFIERAKAAGLQISNIPTLGGIMVWQRGKTLGQADGAGHVSIVERLDSANQILTSESNYSGGAFRTIVRSNSNGCWGLDPSLGFKFRGCIINPAVGRVVYVAPKTTAKTITINGYKCIPEKGTATFTTGPINVRDGAPVEVKDANGKVIRGKAVAQYKKGQSVKYYAKYIGNGHRYVVYKSYSGRVRFVAVSATEDRSKPWATFK